MPNLSNETTYLDVLVDTLYSKEAFASAILKEWALRRLGRPTIVISEDKIVINAQEVLPTVGLTLYFQLVVRNDFKLDLVVNGQRYVTEGQSAGDAIEKFKEFVLDETNSALKEFRK